AGPARAAGAGLAPAPGRRSGTDRAVAVGPGGGAVVQRLSAGVGADHAHLAGRRFGDGAVRLTVRDRLLHRPARGLRRTRDQPGGTDGPPAAARGGGPTDRRPDLDRRGVLIMSRFLDATVAEIRTVPVSPRVKPELLVSGARGTHDRSDFLLVEITTSAGVSGIGEVSATLTWS